MVSDAPVQPQRQAYTQSARDMLALLIRRLPHLRAQHRANLGAGKPDVLLAWVQWFCNRGLAMAVKRGGRVDSVVLCRRVWTREMGEQPYSHDAAAPIAYIEAAVARNPGGMRPLFNLFFLTHGHACLYMVWNRLKHGDRLTVLGMKDAIRLMAA